MRWPWVSRAKYEAVRNLAATRLDEATEDWRDSRAEIKRLTDIIVEMRREGFQPPIPRSDAQIGPTLDDRITAAIAGRAQGLPEVERELVRYAHSLIGTAEPEVIAAAIWRGSDYDGEDE